MAWTASAMFRTWVQTLVSDPGQTAATGYTNLESNTVKVSLHNDSITPNKDAAVAATGFNTGVWATANEVTDVTNWVSGGRALDDSSLGYDASSSGIVMYDATDLAGGGTLTLSATNGCLVYDDTISGGTVADQGVCYNYFGGPQSVTGGTFTIVWHTNGVFRFTV